VLHTFPIGTTSIRGAREIPEKIKTAAKPHASDAQFEGGRHERRVEKIRDLEKEAHMEQH
jgi:hypothetical protein